MCRTHYAFSSSFCTVLLLATTTIGCGGSPDSSSGGGGGSGGGPTADLGQLVEANTPHVVDLNEANKIWHDQADRDLQFIDQVTPKLNSIRDDSSADAAIQEIATLIDQHTDSREYRSLFVEIRQPTNRIQIGNSIASDKVTAFRSEMEKRRRDLLTGDTKQLNLSPEMKQRHSDLIRELGSIRFLVGTQINFSGKREPSDEIQVFVQGETAPVEFEDYLDEKGASTWRSTRINKWVALVEVSDASFDSVKQMIDIGTIAETDPSTNSLLVVLTAADQANLRMKADKRYAEQARQQEERRIRDAANAERRKEQNKARLAGEMAEFIRRRDDALGNVVQSLKMVTNIDNANTGLSRLMSSRGAYRSAAVGLEKMLSRYMDEFQVPFSYDNKEPAYLADIASELDRIKADEKLREYFVLKFGSGLDAEAILNNSLSSQQASNRANQGTNTANQVRPSDLLRKSLPGLTSEEVEESEKAIRLLLLVDPKEVTDQALRTQVADAFKEYYLKSHEFADERITMAFTAWLGEESVPLLLETLDKEINAQNAKGLFAALAVYPSAESARAVTRFIDHKVAGNYACQCLFTMGSVAEEALLEIAPSEKENLSLAAIILLGEIGGQKSIPLIEKAVNTRNPYVKQAATEALKKIRTRGS